MTPTTQFDPAAAKTEARRLLHLGRALEAAGVLQDVLSRFGPDAEAHALMGAALSQCGDEPASVRHFEQAVRLDARRAAHHYNLGVAYERNGNPQWALEGYRHALEVDPFFEPAVKAYYRLAPQFAPAHTTGAPPVQTQHPPDRRD